MDVPSGRAEVPRLWFLGLGRFCAHPISQRLLRDSVAWLAQKEAIRQQPPHGFSRGKNIAHETTLPRHRTSAKD